MKLGHLKIGGGFGALKLVSNRVAKFRLRLRHASKACFTRITGDDREKRGGGGPQMKLAIKNW